MNKKDIVMQLKTDKKACECLLASGFASDSQIRLKAKLDYINSMLERIEQGNKV